MNTPRKIQKLKQDVDFTNLPNWTTDELEKAFKKIRDQKFLTCPNIVGNKRKIPWLYVENGCFARAALSVRLLKQDNTFAIKKIFVFGEFRFKSEWSTNDFVTFKDHVAIGCRVDGNVMILDPSINYVEPLPFDDWISILTSESQDKSFHVSICNSSTMSHNSYCSEKSLKNEIGFREIEINGQIKNYPLTLDYFAMEYLVKEYKNFMKLGINIDDLISE